ncbi:hypothetical protein SADUNF_Sadunf16G0113700 [Salix dunnii]|uniref:Uncharacterized protein n=1 Tax=Salix dunnii TaxID=1413687 RepID=A0A835J9M5_9ROSI|nr:hypothetical protein SADUNF_Sadunf16G0113700 [Salix dunnii]
MACPSKFYSLILVLVLFYMVMEESYGCSAGRGCFFTEAVSPVDVKSRKVLVVLTGGLRRPAGSTGNGEKLEIRELRTAPSGPDPLHHNGGSPKKPRTP